MNATAHTHRGARARRPMTLPRFGWAHWSAKPAALPYEIQTWDSGAKAHLVVASGELDLHAAQSMRETLMSLA
ncbi:MAG: hypothetical protein QOG93_1837, partial [Gaiellaceae bacterium]|nr:hypothetical protein [Gaiellaceae bacterium]